MTDMNQVTSFSPELQHLRPCRTIFMPIIQHGACMWKDCILLLSTLRIVQVSETYNTTDCTSEL